MLIKGLIFVILLFCSQLMAQESVTLQLKWTHQFQFAGYYMAQQKGYYKDAGLDVTIREA
ncbi:ABC transporter substrate-binding protein, partial [Pseudoalteromonas sp. UBA6540]|uniref:ABC transporter substrate-binding protein n=1 Tax=Pseudoalteromonas sp. UBA6540 TaxID=1947293 RepID=UPI00257C5173